MIDLDLYCTIKEPDTQTLADCAINIQGHTHFYTLYLTNQASTLLIVQRTKPSMVSLSLEEFKQKAQPYLDEPKIKSFIEIYEQINQKFELDSKLTQGKSSNNYKI